MKFIKSSLRNIRRSPYQALAAVLIMMLTFLTISFFTFLLAGSSRVINFFESKPQATAFFKNEAKQSDINTMESQIKNTGKVSSVRFVSKKEALKIYKQQNKDDPLLLDLVTADILPASLEVSAFRISDLSGISETLKGSSIVQEVIFQKDIVSTLVSWTAAVRRIWISLVIVLSLVSTFIMITIIGIRISQRKEDIEIMRLIGASNWYIRWPFLFEGMFYAVIGAVIGWTIASLALWYSTPFLSSFLKGIPILPVSPIFLLKVLLAELILAVILGFLSSFLSVLRYLR